MHAFEEQLRTCAEAVEAALDRVLSEDRLGARDGAPACPPRLLEATRHAVLGGGKRFRPFLVIESARLFGGEGPAIVQTACAFECLHCYSLVHDDLPAMDDDDMRRGRPTVHVAYDEATAILVGDGLQTLAFELLATLPDTVPAQTRLKLIQVLARVSGFQGMVGGQYLDLNPGASMSAEGVALLQQMKTGALIRGACVAGALVARADPQGLARLSDYGRIIGEAFQLADDLLDVEGSAEATGKRTGKDAAKGKATLVTVDGVEEARRRLAGLVAEAETVLAPFGSAAARLAEAARFVAARSS